MSTSNKWTYWCWGNSSDSPCEWHQDTFHETYCIQIVRLCGLSQVHSGQKLPQPQPSFSLQAPSVSMPETITQWAPGLWDVVWMASSGMMCNWLDRSKEKKICLIYILLGQPAEPCSICLSWLQSFSGHQNDDLWLYKSLAAPVTLWPCSKQFWTRSLFSDSMC